MLDQKFEILDSFLAPAQVAVEDCPSRTHKSPPLRYDTHQERALSCDRCGSGDDAAGATPQSCGGAAAPAIHHTGGFSSALMPTPQAHCGVTHSSFAGSETLAVMVLKLVHDFPQVLAVLGPIPSITAGGGGWLKLPQLP